MLSWHVVMQTPLKLRTTSVPTMGRFFKVEDVNQDLVVELCDATIKEGWLLNDPSHYVLDVCSTISPCTTQNLLSAEDLLKITPLIIKNKILYHDDHWELTKSQKFCDLLTHLSTTHLHPLQNVVIHLELLNRASELRLCRRRVLNVPLYLLQAQRSTIAWLGNGRITRLAETLPKQGNYWTL